MIAVPLDQMPLHLQPSIAGLRTALDDAMARLRLEEDAVAAAGKENTEFQKKIAQLTKQNGELLALCEQLQAGQAAVQAIADHLAGGVSLDMEAPSIPCVSQGSYELEPENELIPVRCVGRVRLPGFDDESVPVMFRLQRPFYDAEVIE